MVATYTMNSFSIKTFGRVRILKGGEPVDGFVSRKAEALIVYLAVTGERHPRETLAGMFWDELSHERALANLNVVLSSIRKRMGEFLSTSRYEVGIAQETALSVDANNLREIVDPLLADRGKVFDSGDQELERLERALDGYQGDFLRGFHVSGAQRFEEWASIERENLERTTLQGLELLVCHHLERRENSDVIRWASKQLEIDSLYEPAYRHMMLVNARDDRPSRSLTIYDECRQILEEEIDVEPSFETQVLAERIRASISTRKYNLPPSFTPFIGRDHELPLVTQRLLRPDCSLLTITGPGGIGKTRLALEASERLRSAFLNGIFYVPLMNIETREEMCAGIAHALPAILPGKYGMEQQVIDYLRGKELLLFLDGFEHLVDRAGLLGEIISEAPTIKMLITSRERLDLRAEWVVELEGLDYPDPLDTASLHTFSAVQLYIECIRRITPDFELGEADRLPVQKICRTVAGVPLAIELAASRATALPSSEVAHELERSLDILVAQHRDLPERHKSMRAAFDYSWHLLNTEEQYAFKCLTVFRGGFNRLHAQKIGGLTVADITSLAEKSLIRLVSPNRYDIHAILLQYGRERLVADPKLHRELLSEHTAFYLRFLAETHQSLHHVDETGVMEAIEADLNNFIFAWRNIWKQDEATVHLMAFRTWRRFLDVRGRYGEGVESFGEAVQWYKTYLSINGASDRDAHKAYALCLASMAYFCNKVSDSERAVQLLEDAGNILDNEEDDVDLAFYLRTLADVLDVQGQSASAIDLLKRSLEISRNLGDLAGAADSLNLLGITHYFNGSYADAEQAFLESISLRGEMGDLQGVARGLMNLSSLHFRSGDYERSGELLEESLQVARDIGDRWGIAAALNNLGNVADHLGDLKEAKRLFQESLVIKQELGNRRAIASTVHNIGIIAFRQHDFRLARRLYEESLLIRRSTGDRWGEANVLADLGDLDQEEGKIEEAFELYSEALQIAVQIDAQLLMESSLIGIAEIKEHRGEKLRALEIGILISKDEVKDHGIRDRTDRLTSTLEAELSEDELDELRKKMMGQSIRAFASALSSRGIEPNDP